MKLLLGVCCLFGAINAACIAPKSSWPNGPFSTDGNQMVDASGNPVLYVGVNWPGAADTMLPEGLQYQSISNIVSKIKELGMNVIRLTYAIEMIDDILDNGGDVSLSDTLSRALGTQNGTIVLNQILASNPSFTAQTTRLEVFDAVAAECAKQQIYVHLDNHMSRAAWCCSATDGNGWFGDTYFDVAKWKRGLAYMANHLKGWPAATSMSLRNELRSVSDNAAVEATYNWTTWYKNVVPAADGINAANPGLLIFFSGLNYDTTLQPITAGTDLGNGQTFDLTTFSYKNKIVFELHDYENSATNCTAIQSGLYTHGYNAMDTKTSTPVKNIAPVVLTEFGFLQSTDSQSVYAQCLKNWTTSGVRQFSGGHAGGWMQWVLAGSYYIRSGVQDVDETWGLLNHDWSQWRNADAVNDFTKAMVSESFA